jgi:phospholipid N-methyltransferase
MLESIDFGAVRALAEFGPGAGVFTRAITDRVRPGTVFFAVERNPEMAAEVRRRFPTVKLHEASAEQVCELCEAEGLPPEGGLDAIVSGLPFAAFPEALQDSILRAAARALRPGGQLVTFAYYQGLALPAGRRFAAKLLRYFGTIARSRGVLRNIPPAFVYRCVK